MSETIACRRCKCPTNRKAVTQFLLCRWCVFNASYSDLFKANWAPSPYELEALRTQISLCREALRHLEDKDPGPEARNGLQKHLRQYQAITSPMRYLPDEIWYLIFQDLTEDDESHKVKRTLSQVCLQWRDLLASNPSFWNNIIIDEETMERVEELFLKTGSTIPINLSVRLQTNTASSMSFGWMEQYCSRLQKLDFNETIPRNFPLTKSFTVLHSVTLNKSTHFTGYPFNDPSFRIAAPELRNVTFRKISQPFGYPFSWRGLRSLIIQGVSEVPNDTLVEVLKIISPTIQTFVLTVQPTEHEMLHWQGWAVQTQANQDTYPSFKVTLPTLIHLEICLQSGHRTQWLLNSFTTPYLRTIGLGRVSPIIWADTVTSLVQRSFCWPSEAHIIDADNVYHNNGQAINVDDDLHPRNIVGSAVAILSNIPSVATIRMCTYNRERIGDLSNRLGTTTLDPLLQHKVVYLGSPFREVERRQWVERPESPAMPTLVLARAGESLESLSSVQKLEDVDAVFSGSSLERLRRVDIYM